MDIKDILVLVTGGRFDEARLATAAAVADHFKAHTTAAVVNELPDPQLYGAYPGAALPPAATTIDDEFLARGRELRSQTAQRLANVAPDASVVLLDEFRSAAGESVARLARLSDLFVTTKPDEATSSELMSMVFDEVLLEGVCGILCLPDGAAFEPAPDHAVVAWNGSRESARALQASMPFLQQAGKVTAVLIDQPIRRAGESSRPGDELLERLKHFGVDADPVHVVSEERSTAEALGAEVARLRADLLVMGAQGKGGFRQWFLSSVSREILGDAKLPLLVAH